MGKLTVDNELSKERMLVMAYKDGLELNDIPEFIKAIEAFSIKAKEEYKGELVKLYFLPEDLAQMFMQAQEKGE